MKTSKFMEINGLTALRDFARDFELPGEILRQLGGAPIGALTGDGSAVLAEAARQRLVRNERNFKENVALVSNLAILVLAIFVASRLFQGTGASPA